jgi:pimeloyl-ACP methyl ester carboxylesterase
VTRARSWLRPVLIWLGLMLGLYAAAMAYLTVTQESRIFFPRALDAARADEIVRQVPDARHVRLDASDGTRLHGWWRAARPGAPSGRLLLYFGGNAEDVHWRLGRVEAYAGWDLLLTDYRGYGRSDGVPGQAALQADALLWHDRLAAGLDGLPPPKAIVVMGTSLGSYYATHVAAQRPVAGIVLVTPFDSVRDYIQSRMPLVPVGLILRHPMDSRGQAAKVRAPSLFIAAENDITIPPERGRILFDAWGGAPRDWVLVPQSNHETVSAEPLYWEALGRFLAGLP